MRLTPGELKVMRLLWKHGEMKPPEIADFYEPPIKNAALRACLAVLVDKKHVSRKREGRAFYYKAITPQQRAYKSMLSELIDNFCDGSARQLMLNLVEQEKLSKDDLRELKRFADGDAKQDEGTESTGKPKNRKRGGK